MKVFFFLSSRGLPYLLAGLVIALSLYTVFGERGAIDLWRLQGEKAKLDEQNYRLHRENEALRDKIGRLRHDDSYLEQLAREEMNLVRPGEVIYRFAPSEPRGNRSRAPTEPSPPKPPPKARQAKH